MKKRSSVERRRFLLQLLKGAQEPLTGTALAEQAGVSRQVIVQDITLMRAQDVPIVATSRGYLLLPSREAAPRTVRTLAVTHAPEDTLSELCALVDAGVTVETVTVEHPVYGELTAPLLIATREEAEHFSARVRNSGSGFLLQLTGGPHLHRLSAPDEAALDRAERALRSLGMLLPKDR